jgi:protein-S-isoprenylcysteine O-methyltransferase Ste14
VIPAPWHYAGVAIALAGIALGLSSMRLFRSARTTIVPFQESSALLTAGPYRFTRNPIYLSMLLLLLGACVFAGSLGPFVVPPVFVVATERFTILGEEAMLARTFGAEYASYCARVRRWI